MSSNNLSFTSKSARLFGVKSICPYAGLSSIWLVVSRRFRATTASIAMWFSYTTGCLQRVRLFNLSLAGISRKLFGTRRSSNVRSDEVKRLLDVNARSMSNYILRLMLLYTSHSQFYCIDQSKKEITENDKISLDLR